MRSDRREYADEEDPGRERQDGDGEERNGRRADDAAREYARRFKPQPGRYARLRPRDAA